MEDKVKELEKLIRSLEKEEKKGVKFSKMVVTMIIFLNVVFTTSVLYIFLKVGSEPIVLIGAFFAFTTGELWMIASIKKTEVKGGSSEEGIDHN